jgi:endonuclease/exonuclease/phosphatase family metal-dependent hydrolase
MLRFSFIAIFLGFVSVSAVSQSIRVMTLNARYDNPADKPNHWEARKDLLVKLIESEDADVVGTQELLHHQLDYLNGELSDYEMVGIGRQDGAEKGEYAAIFYLKERFLMLEAGHLWLSENPAEIGKIAWDAACERMATWVLLRDLRSNKELFVLNTHFDHVGLTAQVKSAELLVQQIPLLSKGANVIVTGDFNVTPTSAAIQLLTDSSAPWFVTDTRAIAATAKGPDYSFHGFGHVPVKQRSLIDYVFVRGNFRVVKWEVLAEKPKKPFYSDHHAVIAVLKYNH